MPRKKPRAGLLILLVAACGAGAGYALGRLHGEEARPAYAPAPVYEAELDEWETDIVYGDEEDAEEDIADVAAGESGEEPIPPSELLDALFDQKDSPRAQKILIGMVADAARLGPRMLPEIRELLESGEDIRFTALGGKSPGYPTLRVALLAAAEATGDPAAAALIADVAETTESPVEIVFSAHLLDRLDSLDPAIAQRTLDTLAGPLTAEQKRAMASVVRQVVPAAAKADPDYAENFLAVQLRITEGPRPDPRMLAPILDGLPRERARSFVLSTISAVDVNDRTKGVLAGRAAQRADTSMLAGLRNAIQSNTLPPRISSVIARNAMSGRAYGVMEKQARKALKTGDVAAAQDLAKRYEARLAEASKTVQAARTTGAHVPGDVNTQGTLYKQRLAMLLAQIRKVAEKKGH